VQYRDSKGDITMAIPVSELERWLGTLDRYAVVGIDEGGLSLKEVGGSAYLEVGGIEEEGEDA
jgi:hypothetical protein